ILQQLTDAQRHEDLAAVNHRESDAAKQLRRKTFDDDIASLRQGLGGNDGDTFPRAPQILSRLVAIAQRDRGEDETGNALLQPACNVKPDRPKPGNSDL